MFSNPRTTRHLVSRPARRLASFALVAGAGLMGAAAWAQPIPEGVQVFGLMDLNIGRFTGPATGVNSRDSAVSKVDSSGLSTSFWGMRGSESLGNGLTAQFELSSFLRPDTGQAGRSDALPAPVNVAADPFFARNAWVGLASRDWGRIRMGNVTALLFTNAITSNALEGSTTFSPLNLVTFVGSPLTGGTAWKNSIVYDSRSWNGLVLSAANSLSEGEGGNHAVRAAYASGPLALSGAWQSVKRNPTTFADGTSPNDTKAWQLAGSYDFGAVQLFAHLGHIQNNGTAAAPLSLGYKIREISAIVPWGPAGKLRAGYATRSTSDSVAAVPATLAGGNVSRKVLTVGYDHAFSKRTDIYVLALRDRTATRTVGVPAGTVQAGGNGLALGIRHRF